MNAIDIHDLTGFSEPIKKLIEELSKGVGSVYEPTRIVQKAKAEAEALKITSRAEANASAESKMIAKFSELKLIPIEQRIKERVDFIEERRQRNIDNTVSYAIKQLPESVSKEHVDSDWMTNFINKCQDISNKEIQMLWGKILSSEVSNPGSFSYRSLEILSWMNKNDANLFQKYCSYVWSFGAVLSHSEMVWDFFYQKQGLRWDSIRNLESLGLTTTTNFGYLFQTGESKQFLYINDSFLFKNISGKKAFLEAYKLSKAGIELSKLCEVNQNSAYINALKSIYHDIFTINKV